MCLTLTQVLLEVFLKRSSAAPSSGQSTSGKCHKLQKIVWLKLVYLIWTSSINSLFPHRTIHLRNVYIINQSINYSSSFRWRHRHRNNRYVTSLNCLRDMSLEATTASFRL